MHQQTVHQSPVGASKLVLLITLQRRSYQGLVGGGTMFSLISSQRSLHRPLEVPSLELIAFVVSVRM